MKLQRDRRNIDKPDCDLNLRPLNLSGALATKQMIANQSDHHIPNSLIIFAVIDDHPTFLRQFQGLATLHNIQVEMTDQIKIHTTVSLIL